MRIAILHNRDNEKPKAALGEAGCADVVRVAQTVAEVLKTNAHQVEAFAIVNGVEDVEEALVTWAPDLVFNLCESVAGDSRGEPLVPEFLERLGLAYTGSDAAALTKALYKGDTKAHLRVRGIATPDFWLVETVEELAFLELKYPLIVKPSREDASVGIDFESVVQDYASLSKRVAYILSHFHQPALVEHYIKGREIYVSLWGNQPRRALPLTEVTFGKAFDNRPHIVSYSAKWNSESAEFHDSETKRCMLDTLLEKHLVDTALAAFEAVGARDYGRVDIRLNEDGKAWVIDINPNCDLHPKAGFAKAAAEAGVGYDNVILQIVHFALERHHANTDVDGSGQRSFGFVTEPNRDLHSRGGKLRS